MPDDYIKRSDVLFGLHSYASGNDPTLIIAYRVNLCERIEAIPAADVEPVRHGRFITHLNEWMCSECGQFYEGDKPTYPYCANCGAKMQGEKDDVHE